MKPIQRLPKMYLKRKKKKSVHALQPTNLKELGCCQLTFLRRVPTFKRNSSPDRPATPQCRRSPISTSKMTSPIHLGPKQNNQKHKDETEQPKTPRTKTKPANNAQTKRYGQRGHTIEHDSIVICQLAISQITKLLVHTMKASLEERAIGFTTDALSIDFLKTVWKVPYSV